jgi:hypothetical protein
LHFFIQIDEEIKKTEFASEHIELLDEMPGIDVRSAEIIIAEAGIKKTYLRQALLSCSFWCYLR